MPRRVTSVLLVLFSVAAVCFALGLVALGRRDDLMAVLLCGLGGLALRALHQAAHLGGGSS